MTEPRVICIIGPDGAGKSTQARKLVEALERNGVDAEYRWFGFRHLLSLPLLAYARLVGLSEVKELESGRKIGYHYFWRSRVVSTLYPVLLFVDTLLAYVVRVYLPVVVFGRTVVCDRFVHDTVVRVMLSTGDEAFHRSLLGRLFLGLIPDRSVSVLLIADADVLRARRDDVRADETLERMISSYSAIARVSDVERLDAGEPPEEIHEEILRLLD